MRLPGLVAGAVLVGDLLHSPVQLLRPHDACAFDLNAAAASSVPDRAASEPRWVLPAHVAASGAFRAEAGGAGFRLADWADFPPV